MAGGREDMGLELSMGEKFDPDNQKWTPVNPDTKPILLTATCFLFSDVD